MLKITLLAAAISAALGVLAGSHFTALRWSGKMEAQRLDIQAAEHNRERGWNTKLEEVRRDAAKELEDVRRVERSAADGRMRKALTDYARRHTCSPPGGEADPIEVLANVLARADELAEKFAGEADTARARGLACERSYNALTNSLE